MRISTCGIALWAKSFAFGKFQIFLSGMLMRPAISNKGYEGALYSWATTPISSGLRSPLHFVSLCSWIPPSPMRQLAEGSMQGTGEEDDSRSHI